MYNLINVTSQKLLPPWLYHRLIGNWDQNGFKKYFQNTSWIFLARIVSFVVSFLTIAIVARYLGPENLGKLSYAQSFVSLFSMFASLGIDLIIYRDLVAHPEKENTLLGTAIVTKLTFGILTFIATVITSTFIGTDYILTWLIGIIALSFIFQPFGTVGHLFNAKVLAKYPSYISIFVAFLIPILKLIIIFLDKGILYFAGVIALEAFVYGLANVIIYIIVLKKSPQDWRFSFEVFKTLFNDSWPLLLAGLSGYIYARIDQVMIQHYLNSISVGLYEPAVRLTEQLSFIPGTIIGSLFPAVVNARASNILEYKKRLKSLVILCLSISLFFIVLIFIFSPLIIKLLFGNEFMESSKILRIYVWSNMGTVSMSLIFNFFIAEKKSRSFLFFTILGASINVILNMIMIPMFGIYGAAYATVITLFCVVSVFLLVKNKFYRISEQY